MPRPEGKVGLLLGTLGGGFLALGILIALAVWLTDGPWWAAALWLGIFGTVSIVLGFGYVFYRRNLPRDELAWAPAPYGQWFELAFQAPARQVHLWLNLDLEGELEYGGEMLMVDVQLSRNQEDRPVTPFVFRWRGHIRETEHAPNPPGRHLIRVTMHERLLLESRPPQRTGHLRCLARVARLDVSPGDQVRIRGCLHQSTAALVGFRAEAFVA